MIETDLPRYARKKLDSVPKAGEGVNRWLFGTAKTLHSCCSEGDIIEILRNTTRGCGRPIRRGEIERAVERSRPNGASSGNRIIAGAVPPKWPELDCKRLRMITREPFSSADLWEKSPQRFMTEEPQTAAVIDALFPGNPLLCAGRDKTDCRTRLRSEWGDCLCDFQFIVPSPMSARTGINQDGNCSHRCLNNTGSRRFLVVEFDRGSVDTQAALLWYLKTKAPLALVVHSGGKSLHGWFYCDGIANEKVHAFMRRAVSLGADRATWTRCQLVRMPDGLRSTGERQSIIYFDVGVIH